MITPTNLADIVEDKSNAIEPDDIGKIIIDILSTRNGSVIEEINLSPLKKVIKFL